MEELMREVADYAQRNNIKPETVLQNAAGLSGKAWANWVSGGTCTVRTADRVRAYMASHPPVEGAVK